MTNIPEEGFSEISTNKINKICEVEPELKKKKKGNPSNPISMKSKKEWFDESQRLNKLLDEKPLVTPEQSKSITIGLLSGLEILLKLPYTETKKESQEAFSNSLAMASSTSLGMVDPKYLPWIMLSVSFGLITMESFGIKAQAVKEAKLLDVSNMKEPVVLPSSKEIGEKAFE